RGVLSLRRARTQERIRAPQLADVAGQHGDDAHARFATVDHRGEDAERTGAVAASDRVGQLEHGALPATRHLCLHLRGADLAAFGRSEECEALDGIGERAEIGADLLAEQLGRAGLETDGAPARLGTHEAEQLALVEWLQANQAREFSDALAEARALIV